MAFPAFPAERFVGHFRDVRPAHHHRHAGRAHGIGHAVGLRDHARHGAYADESNIIFADVLRDARLVHRLRVPVDQHDFMAGRRERLKEKHPQMRHKVSRNAIVRAIEQYFHGFILL